MPRPRNRVFSRTDSVSPGLIGKMMYATTAKTLPTIESEKSV